VNGAKGDEAVRWVILVSEDRRSAHGLGFHLHAADNDEM
jgi:hypothetical protein